MQEETLPEYRIAYMRHVGPYGDAQIPALWVRFMNWAGSQGLVNPHTLTFGISHDNPQVTAADQCRYDAAIALTGDVQDAAVELGTLPGGRYVTTPFVGTPDEIGPAWERFFRQVADDPAYTMRESCCFERYGADAILDPGIMRFKCELCIPVQ